MKIIRKIFSKKNIKWVALLIVIVIVYILLSFKEDVDVMTIENHDLYQYLTGFKIEYTGKIKINKTKDKITKLSFIDQEIELDSTPIYYQDEEKVLFPKNMSVIYPLEGLQYKINYYSQAYNDFEEVSVKDRSLEKRLFNSIIYDGGDIYFLTEECSVSFNNTEYKLGRLSYVIVDTLNKVVSLYNYEKDEFIQIENVNDEVIISNGKYRVNASLDLMYYNSKSKLFIKSIESLKNLPLKD